MHDPPDAFPPPTPHGVDPTIPTTGSASKTAPTRQGGLDVLDVVLFFTGFFAGVSLCVAVPRVPAEVGYVTAFGLVGVRRLVAPPAPREPRPHTAIVGVLVGLASVAAVLLLGFAGLGFVRLANREPDWQVRRAERLADIRAHSIARTMPIFGDPSSFEADYARIADDEITREKQEHAEHRRNTLGTSVKLTATGALLLTLAYFIERARTRPITHET